MKKFDSINVIPFIDIMLVLLAIVLTTATFVANGQLDLTLPSANASAEAEDVERVEIAIDRSNLYFINGVSTTLESLETELALKDPESRIVLLVDENAPFQNFVTLIDVLKKLSLEKVSIQTRTTD